MQLHIARESINRSEKRWRGNLEVLPKVDEEGDSVP